MVGMFLRVCTLEFPSCYVHHAIRPEAIYQLARPLTRSKLWIERLRVRTAWDRLGRNNQQTKLFSRRTRCGVTFEAGVRFGVVQL